MNVINLGRTEVFFHHSSSYSSRSQPGSTQIGTRLTTIEAAQQRSNWQIWQPAHLPFAGMELVEVQVVGMDDEFSAVVLKYKKDTHWLALLQEPIPDTVGIRRIPVSFPLRQIEVNNRPAAFFNFFVSASAQPQGQLEILNCLWEHGDSLMHLKTPVLPDQVVQSVAESLR